MKKLIYSQPTAEIYELKLRGNVLQGVSPDGTWGKSIQQGTTWGSNGDEDYGME